MVVVQTRGRTLHQPTGGLGKARFENESPVVNIFLPVAEVFHETAGIIGTAGEFCARAQAGEIGVDAGTQPGNFRGRE